MGMLCTERLNLAPISLDDLDLVMELNSDPEVLRYVTGGEAPTRERVIETLTGSIGERWSVVHAASGEFAGWVAAQTTGHGERELGYRLAARFWGRGYATEAAGAVVDHVFADGACMRIWAQAMAVNVASRRVLEHCGFVHVRTFHLEWDEYIDGAEHGDVEYELTRADWRQPATKPAVR
jgi:RimJ/RimL family protein N-acetyltransferase